MNQKVMCKKCLLTDETPGIVFNKEGICNYCDTYQVMKVKGEKALTEELNKFRNPKKKYECMVCISGGRDSTYVLWKMVHDYNLRVFAVTYRNPFHSKQALENVEQAVKILNVDHLYWEFPNNAHFKTTKKHLKIWSHNPSSIMIPFVCAHCKSWCFEFYKIAKNYDIPLIVFGSNPLETALFKKKGFGGARNYHKISNIPKIISKSLNELIKNPWYLTANWFIILKMYLGASHTTPYMRFKYKDISAIRLFDYLKWNEKEVESTIASNLNWKKSDEVESSWRFDCRLDYVRRLMYASVIGVTELIDLLSKMIREGIITKEEALERLENENRVPRKLVDEILSSMELKIEDLNTPINNELLR